MRFSLCVALLAVVGLIGGSSLSAAEPEIKCPVSGKVIGTDHARDFEGGKVYFCCENCPKAFEKDTAKFAAKARHQMLLTGQIKQVHCPLTHKAMKAGTEVDVAGTKIAFCCNNCKGAVEKMSPEDQVAKCFANADCFEPAKK
jgi:YHS domain-containing protein